MPHLSIGEILTRRLNRKPTPAEIAEALQHIRHKGAASFESLSPVHVPPTAPLPAPHKTNGPPPHVHALALRAEAAACARKATGWERLPAGRHVRKSFEAAGLAVEQDYTGHVHFVGRDYAIRAGLCYWVQAPGAALWARLKMRNAVGPEITYGRRIAQTFAICVRSPAAARAVGMHVNLCDTFELRDMLMIAETAETLSIA